ERVGQASQYARTQRAILGTEHRERLFEQRDYLAVEEHVCGLPSATKAQRRARQVRRSLAGREVTGRFRRALIGLAHSRQVAGAPQSIPERQQQLAPEHAVSVEWVAVSQPQCTQALPEVAGRVLVSPHAERAISGTALELD